MNQKIFGQASNMVRCFRLVEGKRCPGMIDIPLGDKGQCPVCGAVCGLREYHLEHGKIRTKSPQEFG